MPMIEVSGLTKKFGQITAVDSLTFSVDEGEVFGLLGPNGAGKTTTVRMLCCLISRTSGTAKLGDLDISHRSETMKIRKMIGIVHDNVGLYETLTAYENLEFYGQMYEAPRDLVKGNIKEYLEMLDLWDQRDRRVVSFSKGMKQKVAVARALIHDPQILFFDEPTANLDPEASKVIRDLILKLKGEGRTIFLNTHNLDEAQRTCDRIGILKTKLIAVDTTKNLENAFARKVTAIVLASLNDSILNAVESRNPKRVTVDGNTIRIEMEDPDRDTPSVVSAISGAGGQIKSVKEEGVSLEGVSLEDVYLSIMRRGQN